MPMRTRAPASKAQQAASSAPPRNSSTPAAAHRVRTISSPRDERISIPPRRVDKSRPKCSSPAEGGALSAAMVLPKARAFRAAQRSLFGIPKSAPHLTPWASPKHGPRALTKPLSRVVTQSHYEAKGLGIPSLRRFVVFWDPQNSASSSPFLYWYQVLIQVLVQ